MENKRKEYEGFGLDGNQILAAVNIGLKPEQLQALKESLAVITLQLKEIYDQIIQAIRGLCASDEFKKQMAAMANINKQVHEFKEYKLPGQVKPWKKKKFYQ